MASGQKFIKLNSGFQCPALGLGTWLSKSGEVYQAVKDAIDVGYRHFDCAIAYQNQHEVGKALAEVIKEGKVKREELFIVSKVFNTHHSRAECLKAVDTILKELQLDYVDLVLMHWPHGFQEGGGLFPKNEDGTMNYSDVDYLECWHAMEETVASGKVKSIGLSNFNSIQIQRILDNCKVKPVTSQVECHPYLSQKKLKEFCESKGIFLTGYGPLTNSGNTFREQGMPFVLDEPLVKKIAEAKSKTPAQVVIRWAIQRGVICIPKSVTRHRIEENVKIWDFELTAEEMSQIDSLDRNLRFLPLTRDSSHKYYPFNVEF